MVREYTQRLIDLVNDTIDPRQWVCPSRQPRSGNTLFGTYCGSPRILFIFEDQDSCGTRNNVTIYGNGWLQQYPAEPGRKPKSDEYYFFRMSSADLDRSLAFLRTFRSRTS